MSSPDHLSKLVASACKYVAQLPESVNYARHVAHYLVLRRTDGGNRFVLLPKMQISKNRTRFPNIAWREDLIKSNKLGVVSKEEKIFRTHMPSLAPEQFSGPSFYSENGLRKIEPYFATYRSRAQSGTWPGVDVTVREFLMAKFPSTPSIILEHEIESGAIGINLETVNGDYIVRTGDVMTRTTHFHESPVLDREVRIIYENADILVVDKPPSWPVHPCGNYRLNSLTYILGKEYRYTDLRPVHRIDRLTSGITMLAKSNSSAARFKLLLGSRTVEKEYIALVYGRFPNHHEMVYSSPLSSHNINRKVVLHTKEKAAVTVFTLIKYFPRENYSLVECRPLTGRTHQIRLHLKELGHPIVNDTLYGDIQPEHLEHASSNHGIKENKDAKHLRYSDTLRHSDMKEDKAELSTNSKLNYSSYAKDSQTLENTLNQSCHQNIALEYRLSNDSKELLEARFSKVTHCLSCQQPGVFLSEEPRFICLHSNRYKIGDFEFRSDSLPQWSQSLDVSSTVHQEDISA